METSIATWPADERRCNMMSLRDYVKMTKLESELYILKFEDTFTDSPHHDFVNVLEQLLQKMDDLLKAPKLALTADEERELQSMYQRLEETMLGTTDLAVKAKVVATSVAVQFILLSLRRFHEESDDDHVDDDDDVHRYEEFQRNVSLLVGYLLRLSGSVRQSSGQLPNRAEAELWNKVRDPLQFVISCCASSLSYAGPRSNLTLSDILTDMSSSLPLDQFLRILYNWEFAVLIDGEASNIEKVLSSMVQKRHQRNTSRLVDRFFRQKQSVASFDDVVLVSNENQGRARFQAVKSSAVLLGRICNQPEAGTRCLFALHIEWIPSVGANVGQSYSNLPSYKTREYPLGMKQIAFYEDSNLLHHDRLTACFLPSRASIRIWLRNSHRKWSLDMGNMVAEYSLIDNTIARVAPANLNRFVNSFCLGNEMFGVEDAWVKGEKLWRNASFLSINPETGFTQTKGSIEQASAKSSYAWLAADGKTMFGALSEEEGKGRSIRTLLDEKSGTVSVKPEVGDLLGIVQHDSRIMVVNDEGKLYCLVPPPDVDLSQHAADVEYACTVLGKIQSVHREPPLTEVKAVANDSEALILLKREGHDVFTDVRIIALNQYGDETLRGALRHISEREVNLENVRRSRAVRTELPKGTAAASAAGAAADTSMYIIGRAAVDFGGLPERAAYRAVRANLRQIKNMTVAGEVKIAIGEIEELFIKYRADLMDNDDNVKRMISETQGEWKSAKDALREVRLYSENSTLQLQALSGSIFMEFLEVAANNITYEIFVDKVRQFFHHFLNQEGAFNIAKDIIADSNMYADLLQRLIFIHTFSGGQGVPETTLQTVEQMLRVLLDEVIEKHDTFESFLAWVYGWKAVIGDVARKHHLGACLVDFFRQSANVEADAGKVLFVQFDDIALVPTGRPEGEGMTHILPTDNLEVDRQQIFITGRLKIAQTTGTFAIFGVVAERVPYLGSVLGIKNIAFYEDVSHRIPHLELRVTAGPLPSGEAVRLWLRKHPHKRETADKSFGILQYTLVDNKIEDLPEANLEDRFVNTFTAGNEVFGVKELSAKKAKAKDAAFHLVDAKTEASSGAGKPKASTYSGKIEKVGARSSCGWKYSTGTMLGALSGSRKAIRVVVAKGPGNDGMEVDGQMEGKMVARNIRVENEMGTLLGLVDHASGIVVINDEGTISRLGPKSIDKIAAEVVNHDDHTDITYEATKLGKLAQQNPTDMPLGDQMEMSFKMYEECQRKLKEVKAVANDLEAYVLTRRDGDDAFTDLDIVPLKEDNSTDI